MGQESHLQGFVLRKAATEQNWDLHSGVHNSKQAKVGIQQIVA